MNAAAVISISVVLSVAASGATAFGVLHFSIRDRAVDVPTTTVPQVTGLSEDDARNNLAARHLAMLVETRKRTGNVEPGHVISQSVQAGTPRPRGEAVSVTLAAPLATVPALTGLSVDHARVTVKKAGYRLKVGAPVAAPEVRAGRVARQTPEVDAPLEPNGVVTVRVAQRPVVAGHPEETGLKTPWETPSAKLTR